MFWLDKTPGFYAIIDPDHCATHAHSLADEALQGGCRALQCAQNRSTIAHSPNSPKRSAERCRDAHVPFIVNDRLDIALLVGADGVHLGQNDLPIADARAIDASICIGVSTHSLEQARRAEAKAQTSSALVQFSRRTPKKTPILLWDSTRFESSQTR
ncbi:MAG: thiamine phosphate synthase [Polyangiales bacterium]